MRRTFKLYGIFGIRIRVHYTWAFVFILVTAIVSTQFAEHYPLWQRIISGIATALLFFTSVSIRELVFSFTAARSKIPVKYVTLFAFGGMWQTTEKDTLPSNELLMSGARFLSNLIIAGGFYGIYAILVNVGNFLFAGVAQWLALIWFTLFLLHFVPGFPLDGGRVLRALLWKSTGNYYRATYIASFTGWSIGLFLIFASVLAFIITQQLFVWLVVAFIGWFLQSGAAQIRHQAILLMALQGTVAQDIMVREYPTITQHMTISQLIRDHILIAGYHYFVVADGEKLQGTLTMHDIKSISRRRWKHTRIGEIMTPSSEINVAHPQQSGASLLEQMDQLRTDDMPVLEGNNIIGIIDRDRLVRLGKTRAEFGV